MKNFSKIYRSEWCLNYRYRHSFIKLTQTTWVVREARPWSLLNDCISQLKMLKFINHVIDKLTKPFFKVDSETEDFLRNFSRQFYLLSELLPEICWEMIAKEILFVFCFDVWLGALTRALRLISQHTAY